MSMHLLNLNKFRKNFNEIPLTVIRNAIIQFINKFLVSVLYIIDSILIIRFISKDVFDQYSVVMTYIFILTIFTDIGINTMVLKEYSKEEKFLSRYFPKILFIHVLLSAGVVIVGSLPLLFINYTNDIKQAILVGLLIIIFASFSRAILLVVQYLLKYRLKAIAEIVGKLVSTSLIIALIFYYERIGVSNIIYIMVIGALTSSLTIYFLLPVKFRIKDLWCDYKFMKNVLYMSIPFSSTLLVNALMVQQDKFLLSILAEPSDVGQYNVAYKVFEFILVIPAYLMNGLYPVLLKNRSNVHLYLKMFKKVIFLLFIISIIILLVGLYFSDFFFLLVWGQEFLQASTIFKILVIGTPIFFLTSPLQMYIVLETNVKKLPIVYAIGLIINLILNIVFIPRFESNGAAIVTIISELLILLLLGIIVYKVTRQRSEI